MTRETIKYDWNIFKNHFKGESTLKPIVKEFQDDQDLIAEVEAQAGRGISKDNLYVISHDDDRTKRVADKVNASEVGVKEEGIKVAIGNLFHKKGDELRAKFEELGFSTAEAGELEEKLDHGKILLLIKND